MARPAKMSGKLPTVLVVHENRGLNPHIEDITRRLALDNFIAFAPDALYPLGGYPGDEEKAVALFAKLDQTKTRNDFLAAAVAEPHDADLAVAAREVFEIVGGRQEIVPRLRLIELREQRNGFFFIARVSAQRVQRTRCERDEVVEREAPRDVLDVRVEPAVLVDDQHRRQLARHLRRPRHVGARFAVAFG